MSDESESIDWFYEAPTEAHTDALGAQLGKSLVRGAIVGLVGVLGAGKTRFVQGIAAGLGISRTEVGSPTFSLVREYHGDLTIYHFDTYRLRTTEEFIDLGSDEMLASDDVCLIEWADRVAIVLPKDVLWVTIGIVSETTRRFEFHAAGVRSACVLARLRSRIGDGKD